MSDSKQRRNFSAEQKASVVRRHLKDDVPISKLAEELKVQPSQIHQWVNQVLEQAEKAFERSAGRRRADAKARRIEQLEAKLIDKNEVIAELMEENVRDKKSQWGTLKGRWVPHDTRDQVVDYVRKWTARAELPARRLLGWLGLSTSKFHQWKDRYGKPNEHNGHVPRDGWLQEWEKQAILDYHDRHPLDGYRTLAFMMLDDDVVAVSPSSVYRVLKNAGRLDRKWQTSSKKGTGFVQPLEPHEHWHIDISYINVGGTFYFLCSLLDGCSRYIVHQELRETMKEWEVEIIVQRGLEKFPGETPRIISDNGPQFVARDFKTFVRLMGMTHWRTSPFYPQSNGKLERWHGSLKRECIRPACPESLAEARRRVQQYVDHYNHARLHSAIDYITPADKLNGLAEEIFAERDRKLEEARQRRLAANQSRRELA